jgi:hypothetical protein
MLKNFKSLFIKTDEEEVQEKKPAPTTEKFSFPVNNSTPVQSNYTPNPAPAPVQAGFAQSASDPVINEVLKIYENGLESINMPGYDFYEFYQSVMVAGNSEQAYNMAFQMAKTLDKTITPQKLTHDAEFYISKINEVHSQYTNQGQTKLNSIQEKKAAEKSKLNSEIDQASTRIAQIKVELAQLEGDINTKRAALGKIDDTYFPQEKAIKEKLSANDFAQKTSIDKLNIIKEGILKFIKG